MTELLPVYIYPFEAEARVSNIYDLSPYRKENTSSYTKIVAVRHHLAGMERLLSPRYKVPIRRSCCNSRELEFFDLREFFFTCD
jgi:hypothetical protein